MFILLLSLLFVFLLYYFYGIYRFNISYRRFIVFGIMGRYSLPERNTCAGLYRLVYDRIRENGLMSYHVYIPHINLRYAMMINRVIDYKIDTSYRNESFHRDLKLLECVIGVKYK